LGKEALKKKIKALVFDRNGYVYTGRVAQVAEGARKAGLEF
jgi:large subunit ribosomal protein L18